MLRPTISISVCIPVYNSERYLARCLQSVAGQNFSGAEIIIVNDGSSGADADGNSCDTIIRQFRKAHKKLPLRLLSHPRNKGLVEARRTAVYEASGEYICILDSDDFLEPGALTALYTAAAESNADIIQGTARTALPPEFDSLEISEQESIKRCAEEKQRAVHMIASGTLHGKDILKGWIIDRNHSGSLWGKLIRRDTYIDALEHIPPVFCTLLEDTLQYFFIAYEAKTYAAVDTLVYNYSISTGISTGRRITSLWQWEQICSASSVFTILFEEINRLPPDALSAEEITAVKKECGSVLIKNIRRLQDVSPELKKDARAVLCEYWGNWLVEAAEQSLSSD